MISLSIYLGLGDYQNKVTDYYLIIIAIVIIIADGFALNDKYEQDKLSKKQHIEIKCE